MTDTNDLTIIGRLTRDADNLAYTTGGTARLNFSIAVNRSQKRDGTYTDRASFFEVVLWGKQAEAIKPYMTKGKQVAVQGYIEQQRWEKDGKTHSKVVIIAQNVQLLGGGQQNQTPQQNSQQPTGFPEDIPW